MAFGFLKKLVSLVTGKKPAAPKGGKGAPNGKQQQEQQKQGHGRRGRHGRHGRDGAQGKDGQSQQQGGNRPQQPRGERKPQNNQPQRNNNQQQRPQGERRGRDGEGRGRRDERRRDGSRRGPMSVNTAANEMRPGGVMSQEEIEKLRAAHATWDPASFQVEPIEGKKRFQDFDLPSEVLHGIADLGFQYCTEIQSLSLQNALDGKNVAGKAQTGSGKTAAFLVAILTRYLRTPDKRAKAGGTPRALVLAPTRELVIQICKDAAAIGKYTGLRSLAVYGGMDLERQAREMLDAPVDLLVATPGRLLDFCKRRVNRIFTSPDDIPQGIDPNSYVVDLRSVDTLVIDEADRMLDMGFIDDVEKIVERLPRMDQRTTMLYSATLTDKEMGIASMWMDKPVKAEVESEHNATDTVRQVVYVIRAEDKFKVLFNHVALHPTARAIVFCNRKSTTEDVYESLKCRGISCEMLSGDVNQNKRLKVLEQFREGAIKIVVATDVAGRGIHVDDVEYVINFDFPYEAEDYVHRIGRTGRAGNTGIAISFADEDESFAIPEIEEYIKEPLKCTIIQDDDPLLKELPKRHTTLGEVDEAAKAAVDAREAVTEEQKAAAAAMVGATMVVKNAAGHEGRVVVQEDLPPRPLPTFENALEPKKVVDETNVYAKPVEQKQRFEEWSLEAPKPAEPAPSADAAAKPVAEASAAPASEAEAAAPAQNA